MQRHHTAASDEDAALLALKAGVDIELPDPNAYRTLAGAGEGRTHPRGGARHAPSRATCA